MRGKLLFHLFPGDLRFHKLPERGMIASRYFTVFIDEIGAFQSDADHPHAGVGQNAVHVLRGLQASSRERGVYSPRRYICRELCL